MNRHLLRNWRRRVGAGDTVICLGDVAHPDAWRDDRLVLDLAECPGERLLVLGNHDRDVPALRRTGFQKTCRTALCATDPPLVLTHIPLLKGTGRPGSTRPTCYCPAA
jgi:calcineurin-like phosphoesterase family protein